MIDVDSLKLNPVQKAAFSLIQQDLRYTYTAIKYINPQESNYIPSMLPYLGVVIDVYNSYGSIKHKNPLAI